MYRSLERLSLTTWIFVVVEILMHMHSTYYSIIVAGDGRYYNTEAMQIICRVLAANGVADIWIPATGIMSTPAVSAAIRERASGQCQGGIILTASHNPGGPGEDFGIKYNLAYGQPAGEDFTDDVSSRTVCSQIESVSWQAESVCCNCLPGCGAPWTNAWYLTHIILPHHTTVTNIHSYTNEV
jgi:phosphoglucomutase